MDTNPEEKKPLDAPAEKEGEKKDAGAQGGCGWSYTSGCGSQVQQLSF